MMKKISHGFSITFCLSSLFLSISTIYAQAPSSQFLTPQQLTNEANRTEQLQVFQYRNSNHQQTVVTTIAALNTNGLLPGSVPYQQKRVNDEFTGNRLQSFYGANVLAPTTSDNVIYRYDGENRNIAQIRTEHDNNGKVHITGKQMTYVLSAHDNYVDVAPIMDPTTATLSSVYHLRTHFNALGKKRYTSDSRYNKAAWDTPAAATASFTYNDLGGVQSQTDSQGDTQTFHYNAQQQVIQTIKTIAWNNPQANDSIKQQKITTTQTIDEVGNTITSEKTAQFIDSLGNALSDQMDSDGKQVKQLDDSQQVIGQTAQAAKGSNALVTQTNYDNFNDTIVSHHDINTAMAVQGRYQFNSLGKMVAATIGDNAIQVSFATDLFGNSASKTVNQRRNYWYTRGSQQELLREVRYTDKGAIEQTYDYAVGKGNGYCVKRTRWAGDVETDCYENVAGKKVLASKVTPEKTQTYVYDYNVGKVRQIQQASTRLGSVNATIHYDYNDTYGWLNSQDNGNGQTINYTYYKDKANRNQPHTKAVNGVTTTYTYNGHQVVKTETKLAALPIATTVQHYGALGELRQNQRMDNLGRVVDTINRYYDNADPLHRVKTISYRNGSAGLLTGSIAYNYTDNNGHYTSHITQKTVSSDDGEKRATDYTYDIGNHLKHSLRTVMDTDGNITTTDTTNTINAWGKTIHKLIKVTGKQSDSTEFGYGYGQLGQLKSIMKNTYTPISLRYDDNGNMRTDDQGGKYVYNDDNKNTRYTNKAGNQTDYAWFGDKRRSKQQGKTRFVYQYVGDHLLDTLVANSDNGQQNWFSINLNGGIRVVIKRDNRGQLVLARTQFLTTDASGSVIAGVTVMGDGTMLPRTHTYYNDDGSVAKTDIKSTTGLDITTVDSSFHGAMPDAETANKNYYKNARSVHAFLGGVTLFTTMDFGKQLIDLYGLDEGNTVENLDVGGHMIGGRAVEVAADLVEAVEAPELEGFEVAGGLLNNYVERGRYTFEGIDDNDLTGGRGEDDRGYRNYIRERLNRVRRLYEHNDRYFNDIGRNLESVGEYGVFGDGAANLRLMGRFNNAQIAVQDPPLLFLDGDFMPNRIGGDGIGYVHRGGDRITAAVQNYEESANALPAREQNLRSAIEQAEQGADDVPPHICPITQGMPTPADSCVLDSTPDTLFSRSALEAHFAAAGERSINPMTGLPASADEMNAAPPELVQENVEWALANGVDPELLGYLEE